MGRRSSKSMRITTGARLHVMWAITTTIAETFATIVVTITGIPIFARFTTDPIARSVTTVIAACIMRGTAAMSGFRWRWIFERKQEWSGTPAIRRAAPFLRRIIGHEKTGGCCRPFFCGYLEYSLLNSSRISSPFFTIFSRIWAFFASRSFFFASAASSSWSLTACSTSAATSAAG